MSHGPVHYDGDRLESLLFNPIDRPEVGNMLSSYLGPDSNFVSRLQITGMYSPLCTLMLVVSLDYDEYANTTSVIGVTETWLNDATSELGNIIGYNFISNHRISKSGGGVGIYGLIQNMDHPCGPGPWTPSRSWSMIYPCGPPLVTYVQV